MNNKIKKLREQLRKIKMNCWNCYECCWIIMFTKDEKKLMDTYLIKKWIREPPNWKWNNYCEYLNINGKCSVYEQRPIICRMFWQVDHNACKCPIKDFQKTIPESNEMKNYRKKVMYKWIMCNNWEKILNNLKTFL